MTNIMPIDRYERALRKFFPFESSFGSVLSTMAANDASFKIDVEDTGEAYLVSAELPGVTRDEIDVELNEGRLSISVEKTETEETKEKHYLHKETSSWSATRGMYLKDAATEGLSAKLVDGILFINVPKQEPKPNVTKVAID